MGIFGDLFSSQPAEDAAKAKIAGIQAGQTQGNTDLSTGLNSAGALYGQAYSPYATLYNKALPGVDAYADATGANGAEGLARAKANYTADPGYSGGLTTGIDQVMRTAAARGDLGGGNTSADEIKFASNYDNQKYSQYVSGLAPWLSAGNSAAAGGASVLGANASANLGVGALKSNLDNGAATGIGNANADADMAKYGASSNFWNAIMGGAKLALAPFTGGASLALPGGSFQTPGTSVSGGFGPITAGGPNGPTPFS